MSLADLKIPLTLDTSEHNLSEDFFIPVLDKSIKYDRGVGYFSSGWFRVNAKGMVAFAENSGKARWIMSPILSEEDWEALEFGMRARLDPVLQRTLGRDIAELARSLSESTRSAIAWMVADNIVDFKIAIPRNKIGQFHAKFGIFWDENNNSLAFTGSYNDSIQGLQNFEAISIFSSWQSGLDVYVNEHVKRFERLWNNEDANYEVFEIPAASRAQLIQLRKYERPYSIPVWLQSISEPKSSTSPLWDHQKDAIIAWEDNKRRGIFNMATGSGKTRTALSAAERCNGLNLLIIAVPSKGLVEQWAIELDRHTSLPSPTLVYKDASLWQDELFTKLRAGYRSGWRSPIVVIGTLTSLSGERFNSVLNDAGTPERTLLIVDEVHNAGAAAYQRILNDAIEWRLGLSATPNRRYDEEGSQVLQNYFEDVVYTYSIAQALTDGRLTPYDYFAYTTPLSPEEYIKYQDLTRQIIVLRGQSSKNDSVTYETSNRLDGDSNNIDLLLFQRANILKECISKLDILLALLENHPPNKCLIYCADKAQLDDISRILNELQIVHLSYTSNTPDAQRRNALQSIAEGRIPVLLAIDCLDEGVDVPAVDMALILASSKNERQFIQRRGRVLRRSPGKVISQLIDLVAVPPEKIGFDGRGLLRGELMRAKAMAELADNRIEALHQLQQQLRPYGILLAELLSGDSDE